MRKGFFVTGTDTGVGKTFVTAAIAASLKKRRIDVGVMKPIETGCIVRNGYLCPEDAMLLREMSQSGDNMELINQYSFATPAAPSIAARVAGETIRLTKIEDAFRVLKMRHDIILIEGIGGLMVPISETELVTDLVAMLDVPLIIVSSRRIGSINHTLLTISSARRHNIDVAGIILNQESSNCTIQSGLGKEILRHGGTPIIGEIPFINRDDDCMQKINQLVDFSLFTRPS